MTITSRRTRPQPPVGPGRVEVPAGVARAARGATRRVTVRIVVVDGHTTVRSSLHTTLDRAPDMIVVAADASGHEALALMARTGADVLVMDLDAAAAAVGAITRAARATRVLILNLRAGQAHVCPWRTPDASQDCASDADARELRDAVYAIASGRAYHRPKAEPYPRSAALDDRSHPRGTRPRGANPTNAHAALQHPSRYAVLSARERNVLRLVAEGFNGPEIGARLGIVAKTVDTYKQRIEDKLGFAHRSDYVRFALSAGLFGPLADGPAAPDCAMTDRPAPGETREEADPPPPRDI